MWARVADDPQHCDRDACPARRAGEASARKDEEQEGAGHGERPAVRGERGDRTRPAQPLAKRLDLVRGLQSLQRCSRNE